MSTDTDRLLISDDDAMENIRRRVQKKIAGQFLEVINPDLMEPEGDSPDHSKLRENMDPDTRKKFESRYEKYRTKTDNYKYSIQNIMWLMVAIAVFYYTDFYFVVRYDIRVNRFWFNLGALLVLVTVSIAAFLIVWLSFIKKVHSDDWERLYPSAIPLATASSIMSGIFLTVGLWPLWNIFTPVILFVLFMGFIVTVAMLPNF